MAGPSIMVKILGDVAGLGKSFTEAGQKGQTAAQGMHSAFSGMLGQLNSTGVLGPFGSALAAADQQIQSMEGHAKKSSEKMIGIGGAAAGVGFALSALGSKDQAAHQQLQASVQATGHSYEQYSGQVDAAIGHQEKFGHTADETQNALQVLTQATHNPTEALKLLGTASDLAAAKHEDLNTAAESLGKAYNGAGRIFKEFGVTAVPTSTQATKQLEAATKTSEAAATASQKAHQHLADTQAELAGKTTLTTAEHIKLRDAQNNVVTADAKATDAHNTLVTAQHNAAEAAKGHNKALDELGNKLKGQASAQANTFTGHLKDMKAVVTDQISQFGQKYGPAIGTAGLALAGFGSAMKGAEAATKALKDSQVIQSAVTKTATALQWLFNAAMDANPVLLIALAVVALVGVVVLLYTHFKIVRAVVDDVWKFLKKAWGDILGVISGVFNWIKDNWPLLLAILLGPFALAVFFIIENWKTILAFFTGLPGDILTALGDLTKLLVQVGEDLLNGFLAGMDWVWTNLILPYLNFYLRIPIVIGDLLHVLEQLGKDVITGFYNGMVWLWNSVVVAWLNIGQAVKNAVGDLSGVLGAAGQALINGLLAGAQWIWNTGVKGWIGGLAGDVTTWAKNMWDGIANGFKGAINVVINAWDALKFTTPALHIPVLNVNTPSVTIGVPYVQPLAEGGIITKTGLFLGHAGEAVTPAPANLGGPVLKIEHAHFNDEMDMDVLMRRVAWLARSRGKRFSAA